MNEVPRPRLVPRRPPWFVWAIAGLLALVAIAWGLVAALLPPARVKALVQAQLAGVLARDARYDDASVSLWPLFRLRITGPALAEPGGFGARAAFRARSIGLDLDVLALLGNRIVVRRLVVDQPQVHLLLRADGTTNFDHVLREPPPGGGGGAPSKPMDLAVQELRIDGGHVLVDDLGAGRRIVFALDTRVGLSAENGGARIATHGETHVRELAFGPETATRAADLNASLAKLDWKIEHQGKLDAAQQRLAFEKLALAFGGTELALSGVVDHPGPAATLDLVARGHGVDLSQIMGFLATADARAVRGIQASGKLDFDLAIRGRMAPQTLPAVTGTAQLADASFRYPGAPASVERLGLHATFTPDAMSIPDARGEVHGSGAPQTVTAQLDVTHFVDPSVRFALQGNLDLAAIGPMVAPRDTKLGGHVALDVRGQGRVKDPAAMTLDGHAQLSQVSVEGAGLPSKVESVNGAIAFSSARADVKGLTAKAGKSSFTLDAAITRPFALMAKPGSTPPANTTFTLVSPYLDLTELLPATPGAPVTPNASGGGHVRIGRLKNQKLDVTNVDAQVTLTPGVVTLPNFALDGYGGRVGGNARFDLNDPAVPVFAVKAKVDSVDADALLSAWTPLKGLLKGRLGTTLDLSGQGQTPDRLTRTLTAQGLAAFANGTIGPAPALEAIANTIGIASARVTRVQDLKLPFAIENGRVVCKDAVLETSLGQWHVTGSGGFDGSLDYGLSGTVPKSMVSGSDLRTALAAGGLTNANGDVLLDLHLGGTTTTPRVALDARSMQARVAGHLSEVLAEQKLKLAEGLVTPAGAGGDSASRAKASADAHALIDSLKKQKGVDILKNLFGGGRRDTTHR